MCSSRWCMISVTQRTDREDVKVALTSSVCRSKSLSVSSQSCGTLFAVWLVRRASELQTFVI